MDTIVLNQDLCYNILAQTVRIRGALLFKSSVGVNYSFNQINHCRAKHSLLGGLRVPAGCLSNTGKPSKECFAMQWVRVSNDELLALYNELGNQKKVAERLGITQGAVSSRLRKNPNYNPDYIPPKATKPVQKSTVINGADFVRMVREGKVPIVEEVQEQPTPKPNPIKAPKPIKVPKPIQQKRVRKPKIRFCRRCKEPVNQDNLLNKKCTICNKCRELLKDKPRRRHYCKKCGVILDRENTTKKKERICKDCKEAELRARIKKQLPEKYCKNCDIAFIPSTERQVYCSRECSNAYSYKQSPYRGVLPTGTVGAISEMIICADLAKRGFDIFRAISPNCFCDLVAIKGDKNLRVEVRTGQTGRNGKTNFIKKAHGKIDFFAVYFPEDDNISYFTYDLIDITTIISDLSKWYS